ncbi:MAG: hypothetical protein SFU53_04245 [Terrimicrobiaceae bacterium]|nr:hypothetical protein [Terrimicrobiaceae bacterium]
MKKLLLVALATALVLHTGCEMHSADKTVPGYAEKMAEKQKKEAKQAESTEPVSANPPRFFPSPAPAH